MLVALLERAGELVSKEELHSASAVLADDPPGTEFYGSDI